MYLYYKVDYFFIKCLDCNLIHIDYSICTRLWPCEIILLCFEGAQCLGSLTIKFLFGFPRHIHLLLCNPVFLSCLFVVNKTGQN